MIISIIFLSVIALISGCDEPDNRNNDEDVRTALLEQINALRQSGCKCGSEFIGPANPLQWNPFLEDAATHHADDMYTNDYFDHISLTGTSPIVRAHDAGYDGEYVGEVIARGYYLTKDAIEAWKQSESHCRALMDSLYNEVGGARKGNYWVVDLGRSK